MEAGVAFHVTARGTCRQPVFFSDQDRAEYLDLVAKHAATETEDPEILGWCCMTSQVYLLMMPLLRNWSGKQAAG